MRPPRCAATKATNRLPLYGQAHGYSVRCPASAAPVQARGAWRAARRGRPCRNFHNLPHRPSHTARTATCQRGKRKSESDSDVNVITAAVHLSLPSHTHERAHTNTQARIENAQAVMHITLCHGFFACFFHPKKQSNAQNCPKNCIFYVWVMKHSVPQSCKITHACNHCTLVVSRHVNARLPKCGGLHEQATKGETRELAPLQASRENASFHNLGFACAFSNHRVSPRRSA